MTTLRRAYRASLLHCVGDPDDADDALRWHDDAWLIVEGGRIVGTQEARSAQRPAADQHIELPGRWLVPGFVDTHVHYPQTDVIASHGTRLLDWLERYTFPTEARFGDPAVAAEAAAFFLDELLANGTTTALVFGTSHRVSVEALFADALQRGLRLIAGQVLMDRHAPEALIGHAATAIDESRDLIRTWHGKERLGYALTPRFAPTSSDAQLAATGALLAECRDLHGGVYLHTHLAENTEELAWVADLFPDDADYLGVYERHGLVGPRSVFAHALHLPNDGCERLAAADAAIAHCPASNLFLGSGLFDLRTAARAGVRVGLGTDVGGGDSFSLLRTVNQAYKVQQMRGHTLSADKAFYLATLGGARALDLDDCIGSFAADNEADFLVLDPAATPLLARRDAAATHWRERLFALMMLGDERCIAATHVLGEPVGERSVAR